MRRAPAARSGLAAAPGMKAPLKRLQPGPVTIGRDQAGGVIEMRHRHGDRGGAHVGIEVFDIGANAVRRDAVDSREQEILGMLGGQEAEPASPAEAHGFARARGEVGTRAYVVVEDVAVVERRLEEEVILRRPFGLREVLQAPAGLISPPSGTALLQGRRLPLLNDELPVGAARPAGRGAGIDQCGLGEGMAEQVADRLEVLRVGLKIEDGGEVAELVRRHVDADLLRDRLGDLLRQRLLALAPASLRHEEIAVRGRRRGGEGSPAGTSGSSPPAPAGFRR